jgi:aryl-alcohol dehydrogenase-like predicted oxidoreductase
MITGTLTADEVLARRPFGRTGLLAPRLAIGTSALGSIPRIYGYGVDADQAATTLRAVLTGPIRFVDTSNSYGGGESERRIGAALAELGGLPDDLLLTTKVDPDGTGDFSGARVRRSLEESSERLGLDSFPLVFLHDPEKIPFEQAMGAGGPVEDWSRCATRAGSVSSASPAGRSTCCAASSPPGCSGRHCRTTGGPCSTVPPGRCSTTAPSAAWRR